MSRIRTIKPEFFRHELLQDLEATRPDLHPMLVFAGLWTLCDKDGRFEWKPRVIKLDILPFLDFDPSASLMLLRENGFVKQYTHGEKLFGLVVNFKTHQRISGKEAQDPPRFPEPIEFNEIEEEIPSEATGKHSGSYLLPRKGKGKGKGKGKDTTAGSKNYTPEFLNAMNEYPKRNGDNPLPRAYRAWNARLDEGHTPEVITDGVVRYAKWCAATGKVGTEMVKQAATFFGPDKSFLSDWTAPPPSTQKRMPVAENFAEIDYGKTDVNLPFEW